MSLLFAFQILYILYSCININVIKILYILSYLILYFQTVTSQCNIYCFIHILMYIQVKQINLKQFYWLDESRSECERAVDCRKRQGFNRNKMTGEVWHTYVTREMSDICRITSWQQKLINRWTTHIKINNTVNFKFSKMDYSAGCWPSMNSLGHPCFTAWHLVRTLYD